MESRAVEYSLVKMLGAMLPNPSPLFVGFFQYVTNDVVNVLKHHLRNANFATTILGSYNIHPQIFLDMSPRPSNMNMYCNSYLICNITITCNMDCIQGEKDCVYPLGNTTNS